MPKHPAPAATFVPDEATRLIFRRAIRNKPDSRVVRVRPQDLVAAFGQQQAEDLAGDPIDLDSLQGKARATRQRELDGLKAERAELQQLVQAGHKDSRRELQELNTLINKLRAGQLRTQALVVVPVGELAPVQFAWCQISSSACSMCL